MLNIFKFLLPATAACALLIGTATLNARAADEKTGKGTISGNLVDKDGKAVAVEGLEIHLVKGGGRGGRGGGGGGGAGGADKSAPKSIEAPGANHLQQGPPPDVATTKTDKDGKFEFKDVAVGQYGVGVRDDDKKIYGRARVTVKDGETATVEIKTSDTPPMRGGRGGGGGGGAPPKQ